MAEDQFDISYASYVLSHELGHYLGLNDMGQPKEWSPYLMRWDHELDFYSAWTSFWFINKLTPENIGDAKLKAIEYYHSIYGEMPWYFL